MRLNDKDNTKHERQNGSRHSIVEYFSSLKTFFSLLISFLIMSGGDVVNEAIGNNISFNALVAIGAYYTIEFATTAFIRLGTQTYYVERQDEKTYLLVQLGTGVLLGIILCVFSPAIVSLFGIEQTQKDVLSNMLAIMVIYVPLDAIGGYLFSVVRLQNKLTEYRRAMIIFYALSIISNVIFFLTLREGVCVLWATVIGYIPSIIYIMRKMEWTHSGKSRRERLRSCIIYGLPLVGADALKRISGFAMNIFASWLPVHLFAIHTICFNAAIAAEAVTDAYAAALFVLIPSKQAGGAARYREERNNLVSYRRDTAPVVFVISVAACFAVVWITHASASIQECLFYEIFYAMIFIPVVFSTPLKDFLTMQGKTRTVFLSTLCGIPAYVLIPLIGVSLPSPEIGLALFGITGAAQVSVRLVMYIRAVHKLDRERGYEADNRKDRENGRFVSAAK